MQHDFVKSTLGHGETMCRHCKGTNRELAALGEMDHCTEAPETKDFHVGDVLSITTGRLLSPSGIGGVYEILNWMTGESLFTHQLPRVGREAQPVLRAAFPQLESANAIAHTITADNYKEALAEFVRRFGETLAVPKMPPGAHAEKGPFAELAEMVDPDRIIGVRI